MKNNKACGVDIVINEFFKYCHNDCLELIVAFFNIVLSTGYVPTDWCLGIICPIYKNKDSIDEPDNYRGITLLSSTCKLFTAGLNSRLSLYANNDILGREQAGFREWYSTIDHAFVLHLVIELYQSVRKRVFCAFIEYRKAFDSIDRSLLWQKLLSYHINGKVFNIIREIYSNAKSCIRKDNMISDYFMCIYMYEIELCTLCDLNVNGDEYHYIMICPYFRQSRELYLKHYFYTRPNMIKFSQLFSSENNRTLSRLAKLITVIMIQF